MNLNYQIYSFLFSLFFGFIYYILFYIFRKYLLYSKLVFSVLYNFIFMIFNVFLYLVCIVKINYGKISYVFFLLFILGVFICRRVFTYFKCKL